MVVLRAVALGSGLMLLGVVPLSAEESAPIEVALKDHRFEPAEIHVKAGQPVVINLHNQDSTAEEFDSDALDIEKIIPGGRSGVVRLHPLAPGRYPFMGEYHSDTAQGVVIAE